jgi:hypothetical protein
MGGAMRKYHLLAVVFLCVLILLAAVYAGGCGNGGGGGGGAEFFVTFTAQGQTFTWTLGATDVEANAFCELLPENGQRFISLATPEVITTSDVDAGTVSNGILLLIDYSGSFTTGTYTAGDGEVEILMAIDDGSTFQNAEYRAAQDEHSSSAAVVVTEVGAQGETIKGTFTATMARDTGEGFGPDPLVITDGSFTLKRIPDDSFVPDQD